MELLDIYNENHIYLGVCEKGLTHKLGLWHEVFNGIIVNKDKKTIILQIKNAKHNGIHKNDMIEISVGGHYVAGEKREDGIREIKEETGIKIEYNKLIYLGERQVSTIVNENYIVREFQQLYIIPSTIEVDKLKSYDDEVSGFVEFKINELIDFLLNKKTKIKGINNKLEIKEFNKDDFVENYLKGDELFLKFAIVAKRYVEGEEKNLLRC